MEPVGIAAVAAVLVAGTAAGAWRRRTNGRLQDVSAPRAAAGTVSSAPGISVSLVESTASGGAASAPVAVEGDGSTRPIEGVVPGETDPSREGQRLDPALLAELGVDREARATLLQFSSAFCAPCRAVRRVSSEVADLVPGVSHVEVDAESHLDAVRALGIWRTPTLLLLDADGRVTKRATGVPTKPHLIAALGEML